MFAICLAVGFVTGLSAQQLEVPSFTSGVERVALTAVVRDARGRMVKDLEAKDFELIDGGRTRQLIGVWSEPSSASVAILMDISGSMATKLELARATADAFIGGLQPGRDEVALFSFDTTLQEVRPFSGDLAASAGAWNESRPFGGTSLWDAISLTSKRVAERQQRRALLVITDGVDSASRLKPSEVSGVASSLDVPVYILVVGFSSEDEAARESQPIHGPLADLANWTGGDSLSIRDAAGVITATRQVLTELQHQYVIAFEPGTAPGWHPLLLRARKEGLFVRARNGYVVGAPSGNH